MINHTKLYEMQKYFMLQEWNWCYETPPFLKKIFILMINPKTVI